MAAECHAMACLFTFVCLIMWTVMSWNVTSDNTSLFLGGASSLWSQMWVYWFLSHCWSLISACCRPFPRSVFSLFFYCQIPRTLSFAAIDTGVFLSQLLPLKYSHASSLPHWLCLISDLIRKPLLPCLFLLINLFLLFNCIFYCLAA